MHRAGFSSHVIDIRRLPSCRQPRFAGTADYASRSMLHCKPTTYSDDLGAQTVPVLIALLVQGLSSPDEVRRCMRCSVILRCAESLMYCFLELYLGDLPWRYGLPCEKAATPQARPAPGKDAPASHADAGAANATAQEAEATDSDSQGDPHMQELDVAEACVHSVAPGDRKSQPFEPEAHRNFCAEASCSSSGVRTTANTSEDVAPEVQPNEMDVGARTWEQSPGIGAESAAHATREEKVCTGGKHPQGKRHHRELSDLEVYSAFYSEYAVYNLPSALVCDRLQRPGTTLATCLKLPAAPRMLS